MGRDAVNFFYNRMKNNSLSMKAASIFSIDN